MNNQTRKPLLSKKVLIVAPFVLYGGVVLVNLILRQLRFRLEFIMNQYWPISIIYPKIPYLPDLITIAAIICLGVALWRAFQSKQSFMIQLSILWLIIIASNLLQGYDMGLVRPADSKTAYDVYYWNDAKTINNPINFLRHYTAIQPNLGYHSRVHPPLPTLIYYYLQQIGQNALVANLILSLLSLSSVWFLYRWLEDYTSLQNAQFIALLFGLGAAFQIFSLATIDGVIVAAFTATLWLFDRYQKQTKFWPIVGCLFVSCLLSFGAAWLFPVMLVIDWTKHKNVRLFCFVTSAVAGLLIVFYLITGYSYLQGFLVAKSFEDSSHFSFTTAGMASYLSSRTMDVAEPILFLGPYLSLLLLRALKSTTFGDHVRIVSLATILSFLGFIATGAYYTGETSRAALFIIPPLMIVLAPYFDRLHLSIRDQQLLFSLVLGQSVLMQLFGYYYF